MAFEKDVPTFEQFIELVETNNPHADLGLIANAYRYAARVHKGQVRSSGEPFFVHPLGVAVILSELKADTPTICAALLHDTLEDTATTIEELKKLFGRSVAKLVEGVTKIQAVIYPTKEVYKAENLRKILLATTKDVRVMIIRLADRLHNMRTLGTFRHDKQKRIAKETLEIYAPIAHKLGVWKLKGELEDLSLRYLEPDVYQRLKEEIAEKRAQREEITKDVVADLTAKLKAAGIPAEVAGRAKYFYSIYKKMVRDNKHIDEIYDLIAIRIITKTVPDCYAALDLVHKTYEPEKERMKDYIQHPKANGYQSIHTTVYNRKKLLEVQIRTEKMHHIAEEGIAAHWRYKGTERDKRFDQKIAWLKQILDWKRKTKDALDFVETLKVDLFENEIIVFTPDGDPISLPEGATPVDFAFAVHTGVGNHCSKAKVNDKLVPLDSELNSGETIEIITQKNSSPSRSWLKFVKTKRAKGKIRAAIGIDAEHNPKSDRVKLLKTQGIPIDLTSCVSVDGAPELGRNLRVSKCCRPFFGDQIIGVKTKEGKITFHKKDCSNVEKISLSRLVKLSWKEDPTRRMIKLRVFLEDRPGLLVELLNLLAGLKLVVKSVNSRARGKRIVMTFKLDMIAESEGYGLLKQVCQLDGVDGGKIQYPDGEELNLS